MHHSEIFQAAANFVCGLAISALYFYSAAEQIALCNIWRSGEMSELAEGARLEIVYAPKAYLGFESPSLRHLFTPSPSLHAGDFFIGAGAAPSTKMRSTTEYGGMAEWLNAAVSKTVLPVTQVTRVRIPLPPPEELPRPARGAFVVAGKRGSNR